MKNSKIIILTVTIILFLGYSGNSNKLFSEKANKNTAIENSNKKNTKSSNQEDIDGIAEQLNKDKKLKLTISRVVDYLLSNNYDVKKALLDYKGTSTDLMHFKSKYDWYISGGAGHSFEKNANSSSTVFSGTSTRITNGNVGLKKQFKTGTSIGASITGSLQDVPGAGMTGIDIGGKGYESGLKVELSQELIKNAFGYADILTEKQLSNTVDIKKFGIRFQLTQLFVDAVIAYWNIAIAEEALVTSEENLKSTIDIKNLIARKMKLGLSEREEIFEWNGKVLEGKNATDIAEKYLFDARLGLLRTLNLDSDLEIELGKTFFIDPPKVTYETAVRNAFLKRIDWANQKIAIKNAELEYKIARNNLMPSMKLNGSFGSKDYSSESFSKTYDDFNPEYSVGLELTYPIGDRAGRARMRTSRLELKKQNVELLKLEKEIRDDVLSKVKECDLKYKVYIQTKKSMEYKQNYYKQVLIKFRRGRYTALKVKLALDSYILSRRAELQSKIEYNIALIQRDFASNVIFDRLGVDIDAVLKRIEN